MLYPHWNDPVAYNEVACVASDSQLEEFKALGDNSHIPAPSYERIVEYLEEHYAMGHELTTSFAYVIFDLWYEFYNEPNEHMTNAQALDGIIRAATTRAKEKE